MHTELCLVRHGVTDWNYDARAQGHTDIPLNPEGLRQAELVAARLGQEDWDAIYCSTLSRAFQTASAIARVTGHTVVTDPRLVERGMGLAEGSTHVERYDRWPGLSIRSVPGVESDEELATRATVALRDIAKRHEGQRVVCVAHGALIAVFLESLVPPGASPFPGGHQRNTATTRVRFDGERFWQEEPSDYSHLLEDGFEFTGEKGRIQYNLAQTNWTELPPAALDKALAHATAVESVWVGERVVAFVRAFTDGVLHGYVDLVKAQPGYRHLVPKLIDRLEARFPDVSFTSLAEERSGD